MDGALGSVGPNQKSWGFRQRGIGSFQYVIHLWSCISGQAENQCQNLRPSYLAEAKKSISKTRNLAGIFFTLRGVSPSRHFQRIIFSSCFLSSFPSVGRIRVVDTCKFNTLILSYVGHKTHNKWIQPPPISLCSFLLHFCFCFVFCFIIQATTAMFT